MKLLIPISILAFVTSCASYHHPTPPAPAHRVSESPELQQRYEKVIGMINDDAKLNEGSKQKLRELLDDYAEKIERKRMRLGHVDENQIKEFRRQFKQIAGVYMGRFRETISEVEQM